MKSLLRRIYRKIFISRTQRVIEDWKIKKLSNLNLKFIAIQHFINTTPPESDILELGVGAGVSLELLAKLATSTNRRYFGFDTFEGFPDGCEKDNNFKSNDRWMFKFFNENFLLSQLKELGLQQNELEKINFIKGFLPNSLKKYSGKPGFVYLDVDLYQSYYDCLRAIYPRLVKNGIILCDEYDEEKTLKVWAGAKIAIDEFVSEYSLELNRHWTGKVYIKK